MYFSKKENKYFLEKKKIKKNKKKSLNRGRLHLNRKGTGLLCKTLLSVLKFFKYNISEYANESNIDKLKNCDEVIQKIYCLRI